LGGALSKSNTAGYVAVYTPGTIPAAVLDAIVRHDSGMKIADSVSTQSGRTTLPFSHLSAHHIAFSTD
jgi:hypothetical protein